MSLTDALAHALHRVAYSDWDEARDDPPVMDVGDLSDSGNGTAFELASAILADPGFREALTAALAETMELHFRPPEAPPGGSYTMETYRRDAAAIVAHMLPVGEALG